MLISDIKRLLNAEVLVGEEYLDKKINGACGSDLMSDVLAYVHVEGILLTGLTNHQVIRTAEMLDLSAIVFVRGKVPPKEVVEMAKDMELVLLSTKYTLFNSCGILYTNGLKGIPIRGADTNGI